MRTLLRVGMTEYEALGPEDPLPSGTPLRFDTEAAARSFLARVRFDHGSLLPLRRLAWQPGQFPESGDSGIEGFLVNCLMRERIRILEYSPVKVVAPEYLPEEEEAAEEPVESTSEPEETSWIEIELIDMEDGPVPGERYIVTLPDGTEKEGTIGSTGIVKVSCDSPGTCKLTFPDLDEEAWESA